MKVELKLKIKLDNGKEVTLGQEEAKELYEKLGEFFEPVVIREKEYYPWPWVNPFPIQHPIIWTSDNTDFTERRDGTVWCSDNAEISFKAEY